MLFHGTRINFALHNQLQNGAGNYDNSFIHLVSVNLVALGIRRRRAWQRLTRKRHFCFLRYKIFRFRQAQQFTALVGLSFYYFTKTCRFLRPRNIWALASSPLASAILNVFFFWSWLKLPARLFNHAQNDHVSTMIRAMHCLMYGALQVPPACVHTFLIFLERLFYFRRDSCFYLCYWRDFSQLIWCGFLIWCDFVFCLARPFYYSPTFSSGYWEQPLSFIIVDS